MVMLLIVAAAFWLAYAATQSDGPWLVFARLRKRYGVFECFTCAAPYAALIALFLHAYAPPILLQVLGVAGIITVVYTIIQRRY